MQKCLYCIIKIDEEINLKSYHDIPVQATRTGGSIAPAHTQPGRRRMWLVVFSRLTPVKETVRFVQEAGWSSRPVWTALKISPARDSIPGPSRPAPSESLYPPLSRGMLQIFLARNATELTTHAYGYYSQPFIARSSIRMWAGIAQAV
jgi:hypothetical protein